MDEKPWKAGTLRPNKPVSFPVKEGGDGLIYPSNGLGCGTFSTDGDNSSHFTTG